MKDLSLALVQTAPRLGRLEDNLEAHLEAVRQASETGASLVVFPELSLSGYVLRDQVPEVALGLDDPALDPLRDASQGVDILFGLVEETPGHLYHNTAVYLRRGEVVHAHRKVYLPTYGLFEEGRDFAPGDRIRAFDAPFGRAGILICEDAWHASSAWLLAQQGVELIFVLSNGPTRGARAGRGVTSVAVWRELLQVTAQFQTSYVVHANRVGYEDGLNFGGGSLVVDPFGRVVHASPALEPSLHVVALEGEVLRRARTAYPLLRDENLELVARELQRVRVLRYDLPDSDPSEDAS